MTTSVHADGNGQGSSLVLNPTVVWLPGNYFKAALVAYNDFKVDIEKHSRGSKDLEKHLSNVENYLFAVEQRDNDYIVGIGMKDMQGDPVTGGVQYVISGVDFGIRKNVDQVKMHET